MTGRLPFPALYQQIILFCGVGTVNTATSLLIILVLSEFLGVHYVLSNIIGYAFGLASGFIMHKTITFRSQLSQKPTARQVLSFLVIFSLGYAAQLGLLLLLVEMIRLPNAFSQIIAWFLYVAVSFTGNKYFTFNGDKHE